MALVLVASCAIVAGCRGGGERSRAAGSAVWIDGASAPLGVADLARLEATGIGELFVDAATFELQGSQARVTPLALPKVPRRARATLVVHGAWPLDKVDDEAGKSLAAALGGVAQQADAAGLAVAGWLLDLDGAPGKGGASFAKAVRGALDPSLQLSAALPRDGLAAEGVDGVLSATDFIVVFVYGTRQGQVADDAAWDFQKVEAATKAADALGEPFLAGVVTRGAVAVVRGGGVVAEPATSLGELAWNPRLRLGHGFSLAAVDRETYSFAADAATRIGDAQIAAGDQVSVVGTSTALMQDLHRRIDGWKLEHLLGEVYDRLPRPGDGISLGVPSLSRIAGDAAAQPDPRISVARLSSEPGRVVVQLTLENPSSEGSDIGQVDSNFVEAYAAGGAFGAVDLGQFPRYDLYAIGPGGRLVRTIRYPTVLRLYVPLLAPGGRIATGPIEIHTVRGGLSDLVVRANFLTLAGGTSEIKPTSWTRLAPAPTPAPTPASR
jgi:hypothetical protein